MAKRPNIAEGQEIKVGPRKVKAIISKVRPEGSQGDCEVVYVWQGKELYEDVKWKEDHWQFLGGAGYVGEGVDPRKQYLDILKGKAPRIPSQSGRQRSYRRPTSR